MKKVHRKNELEEKKLRLLELQGVKKPDSKKEANLFGHKSSKSVHSKEAIERQLKGLA